MYSNANRFCVGDDPADIPMALLQARLDAIDVIMDMFHRLLWCTIAMIVQEQALIVAAQTDRMDVAQALVPGSKIEQVPGDGVGQFRLGIMAFKQALRLRLDVALDLGIATEFTANGILQNGGGVMGLAERHRAINFEIETYCELAIDLLHREMVYGKIAARGDEHDLLENALTIKFDARYGRCLFGWDRKRLHGI